MEQADIRTPGLANLLSSPEYGDGFKVVPRTEDNLIGMRTVTRTFEKAVSHSTKIRSLEPLKKQTWRKKETTQTDFSDFI